MKRLILLAIILGGALQVPAQDYGLIAHPSAINYRTGKLLAQTWTPSPTGPTGVHGGTPAFTHVQSCAAAQGAGPATSYACTFPSNLTAGHFLYGCFFTFFVATGTYTWTGDAGTFAVDLPVYEPNASWQIECRKVVSLTGGGDTITITSSFMNGMSFTFITIDEWANVGAVDQTDNGNSGTGTTASSDSITTMFDGDLILNYCFDATGGGITPESGYTLRATDGSQQGEESKTQAMQGAITATCGLSGSHQWAAHATSFKHL